MKRILLLALLVLALVPVSRLAAQQSPPREAAGAASDSDLLPPPLASPNFFQGRPLHRLGDDPDLRPPEVISAPDPPPLSDFRAGTVVLWCVIDQDGKIGMISVARRLSREADTKAVENLRKWKFKPAVIKKNPVDMLMTVEVVWH
jgi:TonB family protein